MNIINKVKHLIVGVLIPLFAACTLVLTGFSLWQFNITVDESIKFNSQSVEIKKYYDNLGKIEINPIDMGYSGYKIIFEEGNESNIADDTKGIFLLPSIDINIKNVPSSEETIPYCFKMQMNINNENCSTNLNDYFYLRGFTISINSSVYTSTYVNDSAQLPQIPVTTKEYLGMDYTPLLLVSAQTGKNEYELNNLMVTPLFSWKEGKKPQTSDEYGEFLSAINGNGHGYDNNPCVCIITLTIYFGLFTEFGSLNGGTNL